MHQCIPSILYSLFALLTRLSAAGLPSEGEWNSEQRVLKQLPAHPVYPSVHSVEYLDAAPDTVGVMFTTPGAEEDNVAHFWLPLGQRIYTRDTPVLPLHPLTARITTMIASTPERASLEYLDEIECRLFPAFDTPMQISDFSREPPEEYAAVRFSKSDRLVNLADEFGPAGWEVEAYECS